MLLVVLLVALSAAAVVPGCTVVKYTVRIEADRDVSWWAHYHYRYSASSEGGGRGHALDGSGNFETTLPTDTGRIVGVRLEAIKKSEGGRITVYILQGDEVVAQDEATGLGEGASCIWGTP